MCAPIPIATVHGGIVDHEDVRNGVANILVAVEPLTGQRQVEITKRRTRIEFAHFAKRILDAYYPDPVKVRLIMDHLNPQEIASLYAAFEPAEATRLADRLDIHYPPKNGSWLNIAEIEFSAMQRQCPNHRIPDYATKPAAMEAWETARNNRGAPVNLQFTKEKARIKPSRIDPQSCMFDDTRTLPPITQPFRESLSRAGNGLLRLTPP